MSEMLLPYQPQHLGKFLSESRSAAHRSILYSKAQNEPSTTVANSMGRDWCLTHFKRHSSPFPTRTRKQAKRRAFAHLRLTPASLHAFMVAASDLNGHRLRPTNVCGEIRVVPAAAPNDRADVETYHTGHAWDCHQAGKVRCFYSRLSVKRNERRIPLTYAVSASTT